MSIYIDSINRVKDLNNNITVAADMSCDVNNAKSIPLFPSIGVIHNSNDTNANSSNIASDITADTRVAMGYVEAQCYFVNIAILNI